VLCHWHRMTRAVDGHSDPCTQCPPDQLVVSQFFPANQSSPNFFRPISRPPIVHHTLADSWDLVTLRLYCSSQTAVAVRNYLRSFWENHQQQREDCYLTTSHWFFKQILSLKLVRANQSMILRYMKLLRPINFQMRITPQVMNIIQIFIISSIMQISVCYYQSPLQKKRN